MREAKLSQTCMDCGLPWPYYVLHFDHVPGRGVKLFNLAHTENRSEAEIRTEMEKCDLVCANCHAIRTWSRAHASPGLT